jgi:hypothetical protein
MGGGHETYAKPVQDATKLERNAPHSSKSSGSVVLTQKGVLRPLLCGTQVKPMVALRWW